MILLKHYAIWSWDVGYYVLCMNMYIYVKKSEWDSDRDRDFFDITYFKRKKRLNFVFVSSMLQRAKDLR